MQKLKNVMIVDDDEAVHFISRKLLSFYAIVDKVYSAYNGSQALKILRDGCDGVLNLPQLILLDLHMPVMDGLQLLTKIREMDCLKDQKIITAMISATLREADVTTATSLGIDFFFAKPLRMETLDEIFDSR